MNAMTYDHNNGLPERTMDMDDDDDENKDEVLNNEGGLDA